MPVKYKRHPATPESQQRATRFIRWYSRSEQYLKRRIQDNWDWDIAQDTALNIYDLVLYAHIRIKKYYNYFLGSYYSNMLLDKARCAKITTNLIPEQGAEDEDLETREEYAEGLRTEYLEFVRANFSEYEVIIFELYLELFETMKATNIAALLGMKYGKFHKIISKIRAQLASNF